MVNTVDFDKATVKRLHQAYNEAVKNKDEAFIFEGNKYLTAYARYLLEYLDNMLGVDG